MNPVIPVSVVVSPGAYFDYKQMKNVNLIFSKKKYVHEYFSVFTNASKPKLACSSSSKVITASS
jgi:hypothetical protein